MQRFSILFLICFTHCLPARFFFSLSYLFLLLQIVPCFSFFFFKDCLSTHFLEYYLALFFFLLSAEEPSEDVFATHLYYCYYPLQKNVVGQYKRNYVERWCALFFELILFFFFGLTRVVHSSPQSVLLLFYFFFFVLLPAFIEQVYRHVKLHSSMLTFFICELFICGHLCFLPSSLFTNFFFSPFAYILIFFFLFFSFRGHEVLQSID